MAVTLATRVTQVEGCYEKIDSALTSLQKTVIGNGKQGLVTDVADIKSDISFIKGKLEGFGHGPSKKTVTMRRILETAITVGIFALVIGGVVLFLAGRLSIDDIIRILEARAGVS